MAKRLSAVMALALADMAEHGGELVRWQGGYWTHPGCSVKYESPGTGRVPEWHVGTQTIHALLDRGEIVVTERMRRGDPCRVRLSERNADLMKRSA